MPKACWAFWFALLIGSPVFAQAVYSPGFREDPQRDSMSGISVVVNRRWTMWEDEDALSHHEDAGKVEARFGAIGVPRQRSTEFSSVIHLPDIAIRPIPDRDVGHRVSFLYGFKVVDSDVLMSSSERYGLGVFHNVASGASVITYEGSIGEDLPPVLLDPVVDAGYLFLNDTRVSTMQVGPQAGIETQHWMGRWSVGSQFTSTLGYLNREVTRRYGSVYSYRADGLLPAGDAAAFAFDERHANEMTYGLDWRIAAGYALTANAHLNCTLSRTYFAKVYSASEQVYGNYNAIPVGPLPDNARDAWLDSLQLSLVITR